MPSAYRVLFASGAFVAGVFLFLRFYWEGQGSILTSWGWYQLAAFLGGMGLSGAIPGAWLGIVASFGLAPFAVAIVQTALDIAKDPTCCNLWPIGLVMVLFFGLPAPLLGGVIGRLLRRIPRTRPIYFGMLVISLLIAAVLPEIQEMHRSHLETVLMPGLLQRIYRAEIGYKAQRSDGLFACEGRDLPDVGGFGWVKIGSDPTRRFLIVEYYTVKLECPASGGPETFQIIAFPHDSSHPRSPKFRIDAAGTLTPH